MSVKDKDHQVIMSLLFSSFFFVSLYETSIASNCLLFNGFWYLSGIMKPWSKKAGVDSSLDLKNSTKKGEKMLQISNGFHQ